MSEKIIQVCEANGYTDYVELANGRDACIAKLIFTWALLADIDRSGYGDRWCYESYEEALVALAAWEHRGGEGEPNGWHRHPDTGRRREGGDPTKETIQW
jgi:hypothetical protein